MSVRCCDQCYNPFDLESANNSVAAEEGGYAGLVHAECLDAWTEARAKEGRANAPPCDQCSEPIYPLSLGMTIELPGLPMATLHQACQEAYCASKAKACDHCSKPMPGKVVTLRPSTDPAHSGLEYLLHEECVDAFEAARRKRIELKLAEAASAEMQRQGSQTVLKPPVTAKAVLGERCEHCGKVSKTEPMVRTSGPWGAATVHGICSESFKRKRAGSDPSVGVAGLGRCDVCLKRFAMSDVPVMGRAETGTRMVKMHSVCQKKRAAARK